MSSLALVLSAGGARGAYEAGVINYIRTALPPKLIKQNFNILTGTSVGAINTAAMASLAHDPKVQGEMLKDIWFSLTQENIYCRDFGATKHFLASTLGGIFRNLATFNPLKISQRAGAHFTSFLDTSPLRDFLKTHINWKRIKENVDSTPLDAVVINATNLDTGNPELFLYKKDKLEYQGRHLVHEGPIEVEHAMASSAIPIIFPSIHVGDNYYTDGGLRLFTPMSPAIQLGAERLIIVGLRRRAMHQETKAHPIQIKNKKQPTISDQMGRLLNGIFLDRIDFDLQQLKRINMVIEASEKVFGKDYLEKINKQMVKDGHKGDIASRGLKKIRAIEIQPSEFISKLFIDWFQKAEKGAVQFSSLEKLLVRLLDIEPSAGKDLLSYLTFAPSYLRLLFDLGFEDAKSQRQEIIEIMEA